MNAKEKLEELANTFEMASRQSPDSHSIPILATWAETIRDALQELELKDSVSDVEVMPCAKYVAVEGELPPAPAQRINEPLPGCSCPACGWVARQGFGL